MPPKKTAAVPRPAASKSPSKQPAKTAVAKKHPASKPAAVGPKKGAAAKKTGNLHGKGKPEGKDCASPKPKALVWTKKDDHARTIQKYTRRYLAMKTLQKLKKEKQDFDDLMEKLQKEAWLKLVQMEREQAELDRKKEEEERRKRKEEAKRQSKILEAAFDGDNDDIISVLEEAYEIDSKKTNLSDNARQSLIFRHQKALVDCKDANNNTPLSEAAGGGHADTITMLIQRGAAINSRGRYHRTPIWRAAFGGHLQAVQTLLEFGGDPRLVADDGTNAIQVAAIEGVQKVLQDWDITQTDALLKKIESEDLKKADEEKKRQEEEFNRLENEINDADKEYKVCQKELRKAHEELNKRIYEHDRCLNEGMIDKKEITLQSIHDAEATLALLKKKSGTAQDKLSQAKLRLREQKLQDEKETQAENDNFNGIKVIIKDLDEVLFRDVGGKIAADGRWPLIIDPSTQASVFLRYRDTNYINALNQRHVEPDAIRMALLGAIRFGKPLVLDMMEINMFEALITRFDEVEKNLLPSVLDKSILKDNKFLSLVRPEDGEQYSKTAFLGARIENFSLMIITQQWNPPEKLMELTYPMRIIIPSLPDY